MTQKITLIPLEFLCDNRTVPAAPSFKTGNVADVCPLSESLSKKKKKIRFPLQQINSTERSRGAVNPDPWHCCTHWWYSEGWTWLSGWCDTSIPERQPFWGQGFCDINCSREESGTRRKCDNTWFSVIPLGKDCLKDKVQRPCQCMCAKVCECVLCSYLKLKL